MKTYADASLSLAPFPRLPKVDTLSFKVTYKRCQTARRERGGARVFEDVQVLLLLLLCSRAHKVKQAREKVSTLFSEAASQLASTN